jgi:Ni/Fe-hydrogenase subunit HybB-like protein
MGRVLAVVLSVYLTLRFLDLWNRDALHLLLVRRTETYLFLLEIALFLVPMFLLFRKKVHNNPLALYGCAVMVLFGFVSNRLNVSVTGMEAASGTSYFPKWTEVAVTLAIVALGFSIFRLACKHLPIFAPQPTVERVRQRVPVPAAGD